MAAGHTDSSFSFFSELWALTWLAVPATVHYLIFQKATCYWKTSVFQYCVQHILLSYACMHPSVGVKNTANAQYLRSCGPFSPMAQMQLCDSSSHTEKRFIIGITLGVHLRTLSSLPLGKEVEAQHPQHGCVRMSGISAPLHLSIFYIGIHLYSVNLFLFQIRLWRAGWGLVLLKRRGF